MAYEPKEWACGEVVTADALNHIEQGIADAGETVIFSIQEEEVSPGAECPNGGVKLTCSHSWQEIYDALAQGKRVVQVENWGEPEVGSYNVTQMRVKHASGGGGNPYAVMIESLDEPLSFPNATDKVIVICNE